MTAPGFALAQPELLALVLLIPLALWLRRRRGSPAVIFAPAALAAGALPSLRVRLAPLPLAVQVIGLVVMVVALARPVQRVALPREASGVDVMLCLDTSSSMAATDMDPQRSRLAVSRDAASRFVAARPDDRFGLVAFARYPDLTCPLTLDHDAMTEFLAALHQVEPDGPEDRTGIGTAVARAAQVLRDGRAPSKVVILLSDGEENVATEHAPEEIGPARAAVLCAELGVRVYAIAVGIGERDAEGRVTPLDVTDLRRLADRTGGAFYEARDAAAMAAVYAEIDTLEKAPHAEPRFVVYERFAVFAGAGLLLLVLARLLSAAVLGVAP